MIKVLESQNYYTEHERELNKEEKEKYEADKAIEREEMKRKAAEEAAAKKK